MLFEFKPIYPHSDSDRARNAPRIRHNKRKWLPTGFELHQSSFKSANFSMRYSLAAGAERRLKYLILSRESISEYRWGYRWPIVGHATWTNSPPCRLLLTVSEREIFHSRQWKGDVRGALVWKKSDSWVFRFSSEGVWGVTFVHGFCKVFYFCQRAFIRGKLLIFNLLTAFMFYQCTWWFYFAVERCWNLNSIAFTSEMK